MIRLAAVAAGCLGLVASQNAAGQTPDPVSWSATLAGSEADGTEVYEVRAVVEQGWYMYSMRQPEDGPYPLRFRTAGGSGAKLVRAIGPAPEVSYDEGFKARVGKYYGAQTFTVAVRPGSSGPSLEVRYQTCNDRLCLPPRTKPVPVSLFSGG